jgi:hypothetical protein
MIPALPMLFATVLAAVGDESQPLLYVRKLLLLNQFGEAFQSLVELGRLDLLMEICNRLSKQVGPAPSKNFTLNYRVGFASNHKDVLPKYWSLEREGSCPEVVLEWLGDFGLSYGPANEDFYASLHRACVSGKASNFKVSPSSDGFYRFAFEVSYDSPSTFLNKNFVRCGNNADWSVDAWWLGPFGNSPNQTPGDLYVTHDPDDGLFVLVQRFPSDEYNDEFFDIAWGWSKEIYAAALAVRDHVKETQRGMDAPHKGKYLTPAVPRDSTYRDELVRVAKAAMARVP